MRQPEPFFRPKKNRWYVQLGGKQINLGPDEVAAFRRYHEIMAQRASLLQSSCPPPLIRPFLLSSTNS